MGEGEHPEIIMEIRLQKMRLERDAYRLACENALLALKVGAELDAKEILGVALDAGR